MLSIGKLKRGKHVSDYGAIKSWNLVIGDFAPRVSQHPEIKLNHTFRRWGPNFVFISNLIHCRMSQ